jgi:hypothetical protein
VHDGGLVGALVLSGHFLAQFLQHSLVKHEGGGARP